MHRLAQSLCLFRLASLRQLPSKNKGSGLDGVALAALEDVREFVPERFGGFLVDAIADELA